MKHTDCWQGSKLLTMLKFCGENTTVRQKCIEMIKKCFSSGDNEASKEQPSPASQSQKWHLSNKNSIRKPLGASDSHWEPLEIILKATATATATAKAKATATATETLTLPSKAWMERVKETSKDRWFGSNTLQYLNIIFAGLFAQLSLSFQAFCMVSAMLSQSFRTLFAQCSQDVRTV